ncbi:hypothetical protein CRN75_17545 [Yersinia frederiksenii]|nr:hypothetical protein CRN75_17545 [Yersinia frederiksenii]
MFVFAFFITRRNASQSGEGKKECEEKHFIDHCYWLPVMNLVYVSLLLIGTQEKRSLIRLDVKRCS